MLFGQIILVGIGGALGAMLRLLMATIIQQLLSPSVFPYGTMVVNLSGCYFFGLIFGLIEQFSWPRTLHYFLLVGVLGGYTTFSSFAFEGFQLWKAGHFNAMFADFFLQVVLGFASIYLGLITVKVFA